MPDTEPKDCSLCWDDISKHRYSYFSSCNHPMCLPCLIDLVRSWYLCDGVFMFRGCPICRDDSDLSVKLVDATESSGTKRARETEFEELVWKALSMHKHEGAVTEYKLALVCMNLSEFKLDFDVKEEHRKQITLPTMVILKGKWTKEEAVNQSHSLKTFADKGRTNMSKVHLTFNAEIEPCLMYYKKDVE